MGRMVLRFLEEGRVGITLSLVCRFGFVWYGELDKIMMVGHMLKCIGEEA